MAPARELVNARLAHRTAELFRGLYPGLQLEENPDPQAPAGQVGADGVTRYNPRTFDPTTLFHEHGHIWFAPVQAAFPEQANGLLSQMRGTRALARAEALYPELDGVGQQTEAFMEVIGQTGSRALKGYEERAQSALGRFYNLLDRWLYELTARRFEGRLASGTVTLDQVVRHISRELIYGERTGTGRARALTTSALRQLIPAALDQRLGLPNTVADLMEFVSDKHTGASRRGVETTVDNKYHDTKGRDTFFVYSEQQGGSIPYTFSDTDMSVRKREIREKVLLHAAEKESYFTELVTDFFGLSRKDRQERMHGKDPSPAANADRMLTQQLHELFPGFEDGDTVVAYGATTSPQYYDAAFDTGSLVLHISARPDASGRPVVALASMTDESLRETAKGESLFSGIFLTDEQGNDQKSTWNKFKLLRQRYGDNLKMTRTALNLHGLQLQLLAMHLAQQHGVKVSNLAVGKIDNRKILPGQAKLVSTNQTRQVLPLPLLLALKAIRQSPPVRALLTAAPVGSEAHTLLRVLDDDKLYQAEDYAGSALDALERNYAALPGMAPGDASRMLGELRRYRQQVGAAAGPVDRAVSARALQDVIFGHLKELHRMFGPHNADLNADPGFILLTEAWQELSGLNKHLNLPGLAGSVESIYTSFSATVNPFIQHFLQTWDAARNVVTDRFLAYKQSSNELYAALIKEVEGTGLRTVGNRIVHRESAYYRHLLRQETFDWRNPKTGLNEQKTVPVYALLVPGSAEFDKLGPAAQKLIKHQLAQIKEHVTARHQRDLNAKGKSLDPAELEQWYQENWGDGRIPLVRASVRSQVFRGEIADAGKEWLERLLDDNPLHDDTDEAGYHTLNDTYFIQGGEGTYGSEFRARQLGLELDPDYHNAQGKPEEHYRLAADGLDRNNQLEDDLRQAFDIFEMNQLKRELLDDAAVHHKMAKAAMRKREDEIGSFTRKTENSADGSSSEDRSPDEKDLDAMMNKLLFSKRQEANGVGMKRLRNLGSVAGSITSSVAMGFNPMVAVKNQAQYMARAVSIALANGKDDVMFGMPDIAWAAKEFFKPAVRAKLYALGIKYRMLRTDEHDLINETNISGRKRQLLGDISYLSMWTSKIQDDASALFTLLCQMRHENTWDSYSYDKASDTLVYNEQADRKHRGDAVVDAVHASLIQDGTLPPGGKLDRAYDGFLRRNLNSIREEMMGGYDVLSQTSLDTQWHGAMFKQMRGWLLARVTGAFGDERIHPNRGRYDRITGERVNDYQAGVFTSLLKYMANAATFGYILPSELKNLTATDRKNLRLIMYNTAIAASLYLVGRALAGGFDDDKDKSMSTVAVLDAAISETLFIYQAGTLYNAIDSPMVSVAFIGKLGKLFGDVVALDGHAAWQDVKRTAGAAKAINSAVEFISPPPPKLNARN